MKVVRGMINKGEVRQKQDDDDDKGEKEEEERKEKRNLGRS